MVQAPEKKPTLLQVFWSVAASFFGVQSSRARERDFKHGRAGVFIAVGLAMTIGFVLVVLLLVKLVLRSAEQ
jgi:cytochrome b561